MILNEPLSTAKEVVTLLESFVSAQVPQVKSKSPVFTPAG